MIERAEAPHCSVMGFTVSVLEIVPPPRHATTLRCNHVFQAIKLTLEVSHLTDPDLLFSQHALVVSVLALQTLFEKDWDLRQISTATVAGHYQSYVSHSPQLITG